jgi:hypothetical protein
LIILLLQAAAVPAVQKMAMLELAAAVPAASAPRHHLQLLEVLQLQWAAAVPAAQLLRQVQPVQQVQIQCLAVSHRAAAD